MTFSSDRIETVNAVIAKKLEHVEAFFNSGEPVPDGLTLGTKNGGLINLDHIIGAGVGKGQGLTLKFADSGGTTLQNIFSMNTEALISKAKIGTKQDLFIITYGVGIDRADWCNPSYFYLWNAKYEILADGLEITTLYFYPTKSKDDNLPSVKGPSSSWSYTELSEEIGEVLPDDSIKFKSSEEMVDALLNLYRRGAEQSGGLDAVMVTNKELFLDYIDQKLVQKLKDGDNYTFGTKDLDTLEYVQNPTLGKFNISPASDSFEVHTNDEGETVLCKWQAEILNSLTCLLQLPGVILIKESVPSTPTTPTDAPPDATSGGMLHGFEPPPPTTSEPPPVSVPPIRDTTDLTCQGYATGEDSFVDPAQKPDSKRKLVMKLSPSYTMGDKSFDALWSEVFDALRSNSGMGSDGEVFQPVLYPLNDVKILKELINGGLLDGKLKGKPVTIIGDVISVLELYGSVGGASTEPAMQAMSQNSQNFDYISDDNSDTADTMFKPLILKTSHNILSFEVNASHPAIRFFKDNIFYDKKAQNLSKGEYIKLIEKYLKASVEVFSSPASNPFSEESMPYYDYNKEAKDLYSRLSKEDPKAVGSVKMYTDNKSSGLLQYLYHYYRYAAVGTVLATTTTLPYFKYSSVAVLGSDVLVSILRNPSPHDHMLDKVYDTFNSGHYKLVGCKHSISNKHATTTFHIRKVSLPIKEPSEKMDIRGDEDEAGATDLGPRRQEDSLLDLYDQGLGPEYGNYKT